MDMNLQSILDQNPLWIWPTAPRRPITSQVSLYQASALYFKLFTLLKKSSKTFQTLKMLFFIIKSRQVYKISFSYQYMYKRNGRDPR